MTSDEIVAFDIEAAGQDHHHVWGRRPRGVKLEAPNWPKGFRSRPVPATPMWSRYDLGVIESRRDRRRRR